MKRILAVILLFALLLTGCDAPGGPNLSVTFFDVGKADSFLFFSAGECLLMDAGTKSDGKDIAAELRNLSVSKIPTMMITHFDKDHVGGAAQIIEEFGVRKVIQPSYIEPSDDVDEYLAAVERHGVEVITVDSNMSIALGEAALNIYPAGKVYEKDPCNNSSLVTEVIHGNNRLLFTGDIEKERIRDMLDEGIFDEEYDFIKVPHHGKYEKILPELFDKVGAEYAVITSSNKNPEEPETVAALKRAGAECYYTKDGRLTLGSDGKKIEIKR